VSPKLAVLSHVLCSYVQRAAIGSHQLMQHSVGDGDPDYALTW
jgi:hypothetical protein